MPVLRRDFTSREALVAACREAFPGAPGADDVPERTEHPGGPGEAHRRLHAIDPERYARTRNQLDGAVTGLSMYLRHGVLELAEVRDAVLHRCPAGADKLIAELGWRDFFQRVLALEGEGVRESLRAWKTGFDDDDYAERCPDDITQGRTGVDFVDAWVGELRGTGWLHNQQRLKLASYVIHVRRVHWLAGADWMHALLLDGDLGSNHLSWQWVASTFSGKPHLFSADALRAISDGRVDGTVTAADGTLGNPFDRPVEELAEAWLR